jgi:hypothetical protein
VIKEDSLYPGFCRETYSAWPLEIILELLASFTPRAMQGCEIIGESESLQLSESILSMISKLNAKISSKGTKPRKHA